MYNVGNFKSFGDTKFLPRVPEEVFRKIVAASGSDKAKSLYEQVSMYIYGEKPEECLLLGYPNDGHVSGYYSKNVSKADVDFVQKWADVKGFSTLNTRLFKLENGNYELLVASGESKPSSEHTHEGKSIKVVYGDFSEKLQKVAAELKQAVQYAANENQANMLKAYVDSFLTGSVDAHKDSQRYWIKDIGPG